MLYGVRPELQRSVVERGFRLRLYVPFGEQWWPYSARRIGENPRNALLVARAVIGAQRKARSSPMRKPVRIASVLEGEKVELRQRPLEPAHLGHVREQLLVPPCLYQSLGPHWRSSQAWTRSTTSGFVLRSVWLNQ